MSDEDEPTSGGAPAYDSRRVEAYRAPDPSEAPQAGSGILHAAEGEVGPDGTRILRAASSVSAPEPPAENNEPPPKSSSELSERSRKERRRERDAQAERAAQRWLVIGFVTVGVIGIGVVNYSGLFEDGSRALPSPSASASTAPKPTRAPALSVAPDETPDLPALSALKANGLTIAAEGLPEVIAVEPENPPPLLAGIETCRFAYAVWELSPNRAFRFLTTCPVFQGQVLVGAYEIRGSKVVMSPLRADGVELLMVFEVEKPSRMITTVNHQHKTGSMVLEVRQSITAIRPGMEGDGFYRTYAPKNNVEIAGMVKNRGPQDAPPPPPQPKEKGNDPVLDLLKGE